MKQLRLAVKRVLSYFPTNLPVGLTEFNTWSRDIIDLAGPYADSESMVQAIANLLMHASPIDKAQTARSRIPKNWFVKGLRKGAANQVAAHVFYEIQKKNEVKKAQYKAAEDQIAADLKAQLPAEAPATAEADSGQPSIQNSQG